MTRIELDDTSQSSAKHDREIAYLLQLERLLMEGLGSALVEEEIPPDGGRVLVVGCGSGSWAWSWLLCIEGSKCSALTPILS